VIEGLQQDAPTGLSPDPLGPALIRVIATLEAGASGDLAKLRTGLGELRAMGFDDLSRRAALQILLDAGT
jgi:hypothetical protein